MEPLTATVLSQTVEAVAGELIAGVGRTRATVTLAVAWPRLLRMS